MHDRSGTELTREPTAADLVIQTPSTMRVPPGHEREHGHQAVVRPSRDGL